MPSGPSFRKTGREGLGLTRRRLLESGEIVRGSKTLRPLVEFTARTGQLGSDPRLPVAASAELRGMLPLLEERTVRFRWDRTVSEKESEVVRLGAVPPGGEQPETVVAQDAQAELDESAATGVASMTNLLAANSLRGGPGGGPPTPVTLGVRVSMPEQQLFSLGGPSSPSGRGRAEVLVVGPSGIFSQDGAEVCREGSQRE